MVKVRVGRCMVLDVWYKYSIGNPKANVYQYLMAMNPHVQHSLLGYFSESYW